jgi:hypothetical protein
VPSHEYAASSKGSDLPASPSVGDHGQAPALPKGPAGGCSEELSSNRQSLTLFNLENPPEGTRVQSYLDSSKLRDTTHKAVDGDGVVSEGGILLLSFETMPLTAVTNTTVIDHV